MRAPDEFTPLEWLRGDPLVQAWRQVRNDLLLAHFLRTPAKDSHELIEALRPSAADRHLLVVIAFRQPWALDWQLTMAARHLQEVQILVCDNSAEPGASAEIRAVCDRHGIPCLMLPRYRTRHVNRSHGMAMTWIFDNVIRQVEPRTFGFADHDLIPVKPTRPQQMLDRQPVYGLRNPGRPPYWNLWAGYCHYRRDAIAHRPLNFLYDFSRGLDTGGRNWDCRPLNFLYDFSRGLDTGGRNWDCLYNGLDPNELRFAGQRWIELAQPDSHQLRLEVVDDAWLHIGGVGYGSNFERKFDLHSRIRARLEAGEAWEDVVASIAAADTAGGDANRFERLPE